MLTRVSNIPATAWPTGWDDVEVVDSVLVEEPAPRRARAGAVPGAGLYHRSGRVPPSARYGRLGSVVG